MLYVQYSWLTLQMVDLQLTSACEISLLKLLEVVSSDVSYNFNDVLDTNVQHTV